MITVCENEADLDERRSSRGPCSPGPGHYFPLCVVCHKRFDLDDLESC